MIGIAIPVALVSNLAGLMISYHFGLASGPAIILVAGGLYILSLALAPHGLLRPLMPRRHLQA